VHHDHAAAPALSSWGPALLRAGHRRGPATRRRRVLAVLLAVAVLVSVVTVRQLLVEPVRIASGSMAPTLRAGDVVLVDRRAGDPADLGRGDLVTFRSPETGEEMLKRVVALPGDTVATIDAVLHVNGEPVDEPYVDFSEWDGMFTARVTVPADSVYVLGDDRLVSVDSRDFGPVPARAVDGRVLLRLWPPARL
jgi:signal peptidase I